MQIIREKYDSYTFGFDADKYSFKKYDFEDLLDSIKKIGKKKGNVLAGRSSVACVDLEISGPLILKSYKRGGLIRHLNKETYLKLGNSRCEDEFHTLLKAEEAGVKVPEPVVFIEKGNLLSQYWLATKEIPNQKALSLIAALDEKRAGMLMDAVSSEVLKLAANRIYHVDLHPGNVLINNKDEVFIIDFDKSDLSNPGFDKIVEKYRERWKRAVEKYNLPKILVEKFRI